MKIVADVPECIANQLDELTALCNRYPRKVPLGEVAKLLGIDRASLEAMIIAQRCPFGMGWLRETATHRTFSYRPSNCTLGTPSSSSRRCRKIPN